MSPASPEISVDIAILGAGLSGLCVAYYLQQQQPMADILVLEQSDRAGGVIQTFEAEGYRFEAGPNTFQGKSIHLLELANQLGLETKATHPKAKARYIYHQQRLQALPTNPLAFLTSGVLSPKGKWRLLQEYQVVPEIRSNLEESVTEFIQRRFGSEPLNTMIGPFVSGIYAGNPDVLSLKAVFPTLAEFEAESGSVIKGVIKQWTKPRPKPNSNTGSSNTHALLSFEGGLQCLTDALVCAMGEEQLELNWPVDCIEPNAEGYRVINSFGESVQCRQLVVTVPTYVSSPWFLGSDPGLSDLLAQFPYAPIAVVHLGIPKSMIRDPLAGFGFLMALSEHPPLLGAIYASSLFPERAPADHHLLTCFLGGARFSEVVHLSDEALIQVALERLKDVYKTQPLKPSFQKIIRYTHAIPQYTLGHLGRVQELTQWSQNLEGLYFTGNYLHGVSLDACIQAAKQVASAMPVKPLGIVV